MSKYMYFWGLLCEKIEILSQKEIYLNIYELITFNNNQD